MTALRPATPHDREPRCCRSEQRPGTLARPGCHRLRDRLRARRRVRCGSLLVLVLALCAGAGCDFGGEGPPSTCSEAGVQCQLPEGPLGVCERLPCPPGQTAPCFVCTPQH